MIERVREMKTIQSLLKRFPVVGILGARQVGKSTLARTLGKSYGTHCHYFDLENPEDLAQLEDPMLLLKDLKGLVILDEIQRFPDLFPVLRVLADRPKKVARFLILGSASPKLLKQSSETLAGRIAYHELSGFSLDEIGSRNASDLWLRGGFPKSYLARTHKESWEWRRQFIQNFLERDLPQLGITTRATTLYRFWSMLAHYHGQTWNASEFSRSFGVADTTVRHYLDNLTSALVVRQLPPWHENISKRQVKAPKVYLLDSGLLHTLLDIRTNQDLRRHPKQGASWEGFILAELIRRLGAKKEECFFWSTYSGAEIDLVVVRGRTKLGFEIKRTSAPTLTHSLKNALNDLKLKSATIIHAGEKTFSLAKKVRAVSFSRLLEDILPLE